MRKFRRTLESQSAQVEPTGQITFSQIGQIRPIPYRLIVLLNLDTGKFPNRDAHIPFDLMDALRQQLGDRSRLEDDQGPFWMRCFWRRSNCGCFIMVLMSMMGRCVNPPVFCRPFAIIWR
ncbi:MAG: hypothetical protein U1F01_00230 [Acinetobacter sp.]